MTGICAHDAACIQNLFWITAITNANPPLHGQQIPKMLSVHIPSWNLTELRRLGAVPVRPETLGRFGMMAMLCSLTGAMGQFLQRPAAVGRSVDPLASLRARFTGLRKVLLDSVSPATKMPRSLAPPEIQWPGGLQGVALITASNTLTALGIDIFSPGGGTTLAGHIERLDAQGIFGQMVRPGIPAGLVTDLQRLGGLGPGFSLLLGRLSRQAQTPAWPGGLAGLENFLRMGPVGLLCSPGGQDLLPSIAEITGITDRIRHLQLQKHLRIHLPASLRLPGAGLADPFAAFERSGCCAVLSKVTNLQAAGTGARRIEAATASLTAIRQGFGIDPSATDGAQRLTRAVEEMEQAAERLPRSLTSLLDSPDMPRAAMVLSALVQANAHGLLGRVPV